MITKKVYLFLAFMLCLVSNNQIFAQNEAASTTQGYSGVQATPEHKWELGVHVGHAFIAGDINFAPSFGAGIHVRRALDYIFSIRGEILFSKLEGNDERHDRDFTADWFGGSLQGVLSLNNLKWDKPERKANIYVFAGPNVQHHSATYNEKGAVIRELENELSLALDAGAGLAFKISPKFNIGIEHKAAIIFGNRADLLDGYNNPGNTVTTYRDIFNYTSIRLNFNLGSDNKAEPLYWLNPLDLVLQDISELKARPILDLTDTDGDGVIDMMDAEKESPEGAIVDTRGMTLDSDRDGIADYIDKEPFSPPGYQYDAEGVAQKPDPDYTTHDQVQGMIDAAINDFDVTEGALVDWFLPMIHFDVDKYSIKNSQYSNLAGIAQVMKTNPSIRIVATGYTDKTASDQYNIVLSYNRAKSAIEHLVTQYGISRNRLVLNYSGQNNALVPVQGNNYMNRRVEFKVATTEVEMERPQESNTGAGKFSGNKDTGY